MFTPEDTILNEEDNENMNGEKAEITNNEMDPIEVEDGKNSREEDNEFECMPPKEMFTTGNTILYEEDSFMPPMFTPEDTILNEEDNENMNGEKAEISNNEMDPKKVEDGKNSREEDNEVECMPPSRTIKSDENGCDQEKVDVGKLKLKKVRVMVSPINKSRETQTLPDKHQEYLNYNVFCLEKERKTLMKVNF